MPVEAPFNTRVKRFKTLGLYPTLDPTLIRNDNPRVAPNSYYPNYKLCKPLSTISIWKRKQLTEEFSKRLVEKVMDRDMGPGHYDIDMNTFIKTDAPQNIGFSTTQRHDPVKYDVPPPGIYCKDIVKNSSVIKKGLSKIPTFEWDGFVDRFKLSFSETSILPPNEYNPKDPKSIEALLNKVVSRRGPYDMFTGLRDGSTIKNHFTVSSTEGADQFYDIQSELDYLLNHPLRKNCGVFPKIGPSKLFCNRRHQHTPNCYQEPETPGPTTYDITWHTIKCSSRSKYGFNSSVKTRQRPQTIVSAGPGRYFIKYKTCFMHSHRKRRK